MPDDQVAAPSNVDPEMWRSAVTFYEAQLKAKKHARAEESLTNVFNACVELLKQKRTVTIDDVGKQCIAMWGGPKTQSIRNDRDRLKRLVVMVADAQRAVATTKPKLFEQIENPLTAARVNSLDVEVHVLREENKTLRAALKRTRALGALDANSDAVPIADGSRALPMPELFTMAEIDAVRQFLDAIDRGDEDYIFDARTGSLIREANGREAAGPGFEQALRKISGRPRARSENAA